MPTAGNLSERVLRLAAGWEKRPENGQSGPAPGTGAPAREIPCPGAGQPVPHAQARLSLFPGEGAPADEGRRHPLPAKEGLQSHHQLPPQLPHRAKPAPTPVHFQPPQPSLGGRHHLHPHRGRLAVFSHCQRPVHQENRGLCLFPAHRHPAHPGRPEHGRPPGVPCPWTDLPQRPGRPVRRRGLP